MAVREGVEGNPGDIWYGGLVWYGTYLMSSSSSRGSKTAMLSRGTTEWKPFSSASSCGSEGEGRHAGCAVGEGGGTGKTGGGRG